MKNINKINIVLISFIVLYSCQNNKLDFDASGVFEAQETIISSQASGIIKRFQIEEGQYVEANTTIGYVDSLQLYLKKKHLEAQAVTILSKKSDIDVQLSSFREQLTTAEKEKIRIANLIQGNAATTKQLDDINAQIEVIKKQIEAQHSSLSKTNETLSKEVELLQIQIAQVDDQLEKCQLVNPINGTILIKYAEANEMTAIGKPLYKIADLSTIVLKAYITGNQLPKVKLNQQVNVFTDNGKDGYIQTQGIITWINDRAEFTPKTIQTKNERANKVYAVKVRIKNNGTYKIGMYGELKF